MGLKSVAHPMIEITLVHVTRTKITSVTSKYGVSTNKKNFNIIFYTD